MTRKGRHLSRRELLKQGVVAASAGAAVVAYPGAGALSAQTPAVITARRFRGWISRGDGPGRTPLQELTLRPIGGRQVVVRTEATNLCYSNVSAVLGVQPDAGARAAAAPSAL